MTIQSFMTKVEDKSLNLSFKVEIHFPVRNMSFKFFINESISSFVYFYDQILRVRVRKSFENTVLYAETP